MEDGCLVFSSACSHQDLGRAVLDILVPLEALARNPNKKYEECYLPGASGGVGTILLCSPQFMSQHTGTIISSVHFLA